jgi:acetoin:2,6-dichlorophenolindophenol oxidoreductase subunit beta
MTEITYQEAARLAMADALAESDRVVMLGEDIAEAGGVFKVTEGLQERFGTNRVLDTPISEQAIVGAAIGAALKGLRPIAEIMFADFAATCYDQIANQLAKYRYMTGGQVSLPVTMRLVNGAGGGFASQHSQAVENWFLGAFGLKIVVPGSVADMHRLLLAAVRDENPVLVFEHKRMYALKGALDDGTPPVELGKAAVIRTGEHVTVVATQLMRQRCEQAAVELAAGGVEIELIDPRTILPLDYDTIAASLERTNRLVVVQESSSPGSWGATLVARIATDCFESLDAPPVLVSGADSPIPYAGSLEEAWLPSAERIAAAIRGSVTA